MIATLTEKRIELSFTRISIGSAFVYSACLVLLGLALSGVLNLSLIETFGFITGAICVWYYVEENSLTWPIGILNAAFLGIVFFNAKLFADSGLQIVYIVIGVLGWYWWLRGGKNKTELQVSLAPFKELFILAVLGIIGVAILTKYLETIDDAAPFWDALTTVMSLIAQYMISRKYLENWIIWILTDIIYIPLYFWKDLPLTGVLYVFFLAMCVAGLFQWLRVYEDKTDGEEVRERVETDVLESY